MGSPDALIRATVNRLSARLGHGLADAAAELAVLAQDAPERLRQEWDLFQEEVQAEAAEKEEQERLWHLRRIFRMAMLEVSFLRDN